MHNIKIKAVKLLKDGEKVEISYKEILADKSHSTTSKECDTPPHPDFKQSVESLRLHLAILTDYITEKEVKKNQGELENFVASGYSVGGNEDDGIGYTIKGYRKTIRGGTVTLNTPFTKAEAGDEFKYSLMEQLEKAIAAIEAEVIEYLFNGKRASEPQQKLEL